MTSNYSTYDGSATAGFDADGNAFTYDDEHWGRERDFYDSQGVPDELIEMAKPLLLQGTWEQTQAAQSILEAASGTLHTEPGHQRDMARALRQAGMEVAKPSQQSEEDVMDEWERQSPSPRTQAPQIFGFNEGS